MQARKIRYDIIGLAETDYAFYYTGEEQFLEACDSRGVSSVHVNTSLSVSIDSFEQLTTPIGRLRLKRCGAIAALTIVFVCAPDIKLW
ncbi:unnamed protein product [Angiostrongylus costaricensis]|uniref:Aldo_ket_red domain-containing protein n=1 Tax=Angiostrongylus costaricensis TaxID=334426 RepID=A0A0R3PWT1_ANGCS|nr:unnamed protein product [Angiostrongylus costaricensis]